MDLSTFIVAVFCLVDDRLRDREPLRRRGPAPTLSDAEVLTIEIVAEFLGLDTDKDIYLFFRRHYSEWFPALGQVHRTTPSAARRPTSGSSRKTSGRSSVGRHSPRPRLRYLRLDAPACVLVRPRLPLPPLSG